MRIVITGAPGTGKSVIARLLSKSLDLPLISLKKLVLDLSLRERGGEVDVGKLQKILYQHIRSAHYADYVIEGHLACEFLIPADYVFVLRTKPETLNTRLSRRGYGPRKIKENLQTELLDYCTQRVNSVYHRIPLELDTSRLKPESAAKKLEFALRHKKKKLDNISYSLSKYRDLL